MEKIKKFCPIFILMLLILPCHAALGSQASDELPAAQFTLPAPDSPQAQKYLGLKSMEPFPVSGIQGKIVVFEFFSALCPQCLANAPIVNKIHKVISEDSSLADVKFVGIAVETNKAQMAAYRKNFKVAFPTFIDENFAISASMDGVEVPTTMIVDIKTGKVLSSHKGVIKDSDGFLKELRAMHKKL
ncbi:MAG: TlpA disulfide reductase family protein [Syntrophobacteraceae bacterium]